MRSVAPSRTRDDAKAAAGRWRLLRAPCCATAEQSACMLGHVSQRETHPPVQARSK